MPIELWDTADLLGLVNSDQLPRPDTFWLDMFDRVYYSERQEIFFDDLPEEDRRMAPFVSWNVQVPLMTQGNARFGSFRPAYTKIGHVITPDKAVPRRPGEAPLGSLSLQERINRIIAENIRVENDTIDRREDWMACQAIQHGFVDVVGKDYPLRRVTFDRDPSLTYNLSSGSYWDQSTSSPSKDINLGRRNAYQRGKASVRRLVMGVDAFEAWQMHDESKKLLDNQVRGSTTDFNNTGYYSDDSPAQLQATVSGPGGGGIVQIWTYSNSYTDPETKQTVELLDPRDVVGIGPSLRGIRCYGAILNLASMEAVDRFPSNWTEVNPSRAFTAVESAPLPAVMNANNTFKMRVLA